MYELTLRSDARLFLPSTSFMASVISLPRSCMVSMALWWKHTLLTHTSIAIFSCLYNFTEVLRQIVVILCIIGLTHLHLKPTQGSIQYQFLTLMLPVANLSNTKWCQKTWKWLKPWHMGTHLKVLSESYPVNTNMTGFTCLSKIFASLCFGQKEPQHWKG